MKSESIDTLEAGYRTSFWQDRLSAQVNLFYSRINDFIYSKPTDEIPGLGIYTRAQFNNFGSADAMGGECSIKIKWGENVRAFLNYSFEELYITQDDPFTPENEDGDRMEASPRHKVNAGGSVRFDNGITATLAAHYVSATFWEINLSAPIHRPLDDIFYPGSSVDKPQGAQGHDQSGNPPADHSTVSASRSLSFDGLLHPLPPSGETGWPGMQGIQTCLVFL